MIKQASKSEELNLAWSDFELGHTLT